VRVVVPVRVVVLRVPVALVRPGVPLVVPVTPAFLVLVVVVVPFRELETIGFRAVVPVTVFVAPVAVFAVPLVVPVVDRLVVVPVAVFVPRRGLVVDFAEPGRVFVVPVADFGVPVAVFVPRRDFEVGDVADVALFVAVVGRAVLVLAAVVLVVEPGVFGVDLVVPVLAFTGEVVAVAVLFRVVDPLAAVAVPFRVVDALAAVAVPFRVVDTFAAALVPLFVPLNVALRVVDTFALPLYLAFILPRTSSSRPRHFARNASVTGSLSGANSW